MEETLRVLLVDDHVLFRSALATLLSSRGGVEVVGEAGDGVQAIELARKTVPDVILMDVYMPTCSGIEAVKVIKGEMPHVRIIMLTVSDVDEDLFEAIKNGAQGYLLKNLEPQQLFDSLEGARRGDAALSGAMMARILAEFRQPGKSVTTSQEVLEQLTPREFDVLEQVVEGATNSEIAEALDITVNTVKIHLRNILEKLHLRNRIQVAVYAVREGLVGDSTRLK